MVQKMYHFLKRILASNISAGLEFLFIFLNVVFGVSENHTKGQLLIIMRNKLVNCVKTCFFKIQHILLLMSLELIKYPLLQPLIFILLGLIRTQGIPFVYCYHYGLLISLDDIFENSEPNIVAEVIINDDKTRTIITKDDGIFTLTKSTSRLDSVFANDTESGYWNNNERYDNKHIVTITKSSPMIETTYPSRVVEVQPDGNLTAEDAHYAQRPQMASPVTESKIEQEPNVVQQEPEVVQQLPITKDAITLRAEIQHLHPIEQAVQIRAFMYNEIADKIELNGGGMVNLKAIIYESVNNPILKPIWLIPYKGHLDDNQVAVNIIGMNHTDIHDVTNVPLHARKVLVHMSVQMIFTNIAQSEDIPVELLLSNKALYKDQLIKITQTKP